MSCVKSPIIPLLVSVMAIPYLRSLSLWIVSLITQAVRILEWFSLGWKFFIFVCNVCILQRPRASVAAAVAQIAALSLSSTTSPLSRGPLVGASTHQHGKPVMSKVCKGQGHLSQATKGGRHQPESSKVASSATAGSFRNWSNQSRKWLNWVLAHGLALVCQLTFGNQSEPWNMQTVMSFLFLSRLTYADFQEAMCYFWG